MILTSKQRFFQPEICAVFDGANQQSNGEVDVKTDPLSVIKAKIGDGKLTAVAHRIVHGGPEFTDHQIITPEVIGGAEKDRGAWRPIICRPKSS